MPKFRKRGNCIKKYNVIYADPPWRDTTTGTTQLRLGETKLDQKKESPKEKEVKKSIASPFPLPLKLHCHSEIWRFAYDGIFRLKESRVTEIE